MKIGDLVATEEIENQSEYKWVVLSPLTLDADECVTGGYVYVVA